MRTTYHSGNQPASRLQVLINVLQLHHKELINQYYKGLRRQIMTLPVTDYLIN